MARAERVLALVSEGAWTEVRLAMDECANRRVHLGGVAPEMELRRAPVQEPRAVLAQLSRESWTAFVVEAIS